MVISTNIPDVSFETGFKYIIFFPPKIPFSDKLKINNLSLYHKNQKGYGWNLNIILNYKGEILNSFKDFLDITDPEIIQLKLYSADYGEIRKIEFDETITIIEWKQKESMPIISPNFITTDNETW